MNSLRVWRDILVLNWDGELPPGTPDSAIHEDNDVVYFWPHLKGYARYSKKVGGFVLSASSHNLRRVHRQFGKIPVIEGKRNLEQLKSQLNYFRGMLDMAGRIKSGDFDIPVDYKVSPLAEYQHHEVVFLICVPRSAIFADCGTGKTFCVLVSTEHQIRNGIVPPGKTLICGKLATLETGWLDDARKFTNLKVTNLWVPNSRTKAKRREKFLARLNDPSDVYVINHESMRVFEEDLAAVKFTKVVVDESTILKGFKGEGSRVAGGKFGKSLMKVARHANWRVIMSGTPSPNSPEDLWGQYHFLDPEGFILERSVNDFRSRWMKEYYFGDERNPNTPKKWVMASGASEEIGNIVSASSFRVRIRDHLKELPEKTVVSRKMAMGRKQRKHYKEMEEELRTVINDERVAVENRLAELGKLRQITGGFLIDHDEKPHAITPNPKLEMMDSLLNDEIDRSKKVVIFAQYRWEIETLQSRYKDHGVVTVYGGNNAQRNLENIRSFIDSPDVRLIILHPKSAAHGVTLTVAHYLIFYSISYSAEDNYQCVARIERASQKHPMFVYYLMCTDSIDDKIFKVIQRKTKNQEKLIDQKELDEELIAEFVGRPA